MFQDVKEREVFVEKDIDHKENKLKVPSSSSKVAWLKSQLGILRNKRNNDLERFQFHFSLQCIVKTLGLRDLFALIKTLHLNRY